MQTLLAVLAGAAAATTPWTTTQLAQAYLNAGRPKFFDADGLLANSTTVSSAAAAGVLAESFTLILVRQADLAGGTVDSYAQTVASNIYPNPTDSAGALVTVAVLTPSAVGAYPGYNVRYLYPNVTIANMIVRPLELYRQGEVEPATLALVENLEHPERFEMLTWRGIFYLVVGGVLAALCLVDLALISARRSAQNRLRNVFAEYQRRKAEGWQLADFFQQCCLVCLRGFGLANPDHSPSDRSLAAEVCALSCGHLFHADCLEKQFLVALHCPICQNERYISSLPLFEEALLAYHTHKERHWLSPGTIRFLFAHPTTRAASSRYRCSADETI